MPSYIATFYTHYDAIVYRRLLHQLGIKGEMMPVPRKLSSSCGTCVSFKACPEQLDLISRDILERLVRRENEAYIDIVDNR